jgi:hypothetical protein
MSLPQAVPPRNVQTYACSPLKAAGRLRPTYVNSVGRGRSSSWVWRCNRLTITMRLIVTTVARAWQPGGRDGTRNA